MPGVLLADDSKPIRRIVELTLRESDVDLRAAADAEQARAILDQGFVPDLALVDVHMPRTSGLELCRDLRQRLPGVKVLLLVGTFEPFNPDEAEEAGAAGHLLKPFSADELRQRVNEMLAVSERQEADTTAVAPSILTAPEPAPEPPAAATPSANSEATDSDLRVVDLDALAQRVAEQLAGDLRPVLEDLFTRVAREEVRARINEIERGLDVDADPDD